MSDDAQLPKISVVIPVRPSETVSAAIDSLRHVDYPSDRIEIRVIRGTQPSKQRNIGIRTSLGDVVYFLDNDSLASEGLFRTAASHFVEEGVIGVAGPNLSAESAHPVARAVDAVFCSVFGTGGIRARYASVGKPRVAGEHDVIFCNLAIRKDVLEKVGGLNEELYPNEENELYERLVASAPGAKFMYDPAAVVRRPRSERIGGHLRQIFRYGIGRMKQTFYRPNALCLFHMIPAFFLLYLVAAPIVAIVWHWPWVFAPLGLYAALVVLFSLKEGVGRRSPAIIGILLILFPLTHLAYGAGLLIGLFRYAFLRWRPRTGEAELVLVKGFDDAISSARIPE